MTVECACNQPPFWYVGFHTRDLGEDSRGGEVSIEVCAKCRAWWLKYLIEQPWHSRSGRWWRARIDPERGRTLRADDAKALIESQDWCFVGGSFYDAGDHRIAKPIRVV